MVALRQDDREDRGTVLKKRRLLIKFNKVEEFLIDKFGII